MSDDKNQSVNITGDLHGDFNLAGRDINKKETVMGDKIEVGDINNSTGVAIGKNIQQTINAAPPANKALLEALLAEIKALDLDEDEQEDAVKNTTRIVAVLQDESPDEGKLKRWFNNLKDVAPRIATKLAEGAAEASASAAVAAILAKLAGA